MSRISVLGLGAMGSRMAARLLQAGHDVTVWNRSPEAAAPLVAQGARQAATPREAATGAAFVLAMLRDDEASRSVWLEGETGALGGMAAGSTALESSTLTPAWVRELGATAMARGVALLEAPVSGSRPQAEAGQLVVLAGGEAGVLARAMPVLGAIGGAVHHAGPLGAGAVLKLVTNALLGIQVAAYAELIPLIERQGMDPGAAVRILSQTSVFAPVAHYLAGSMVAGQFAPQFPVALIEKDFGYLLACDGAAEKLPASAAVRDVFRRAIEAGLGELNMTGAVQLHRRWARGEA